MFAFTTDQSDAKYHEHLSHSTLPVIMIELASFIIEFDGTLLLVVLLSESLVCFESLSDLCVHVKLV